jgi:hypothetical protein
VAERLLVCSGSPPPTLRPAFFSFEDACAGSNNNLVIILSGWWQSTLLISKISPPCTRKQADVLDSKPQKTHSWDPIKRRLISFSLLLIGFLFFFDPRERRLFWPGPQRGFESNTVLVSAKTESFTSACFLYHPNRRAHPRGVHGITLYGGSRPSY